MKDEEDGEIRSDKGEKDPDADDDKGNGGNGLEIGQTKQYCRQTFKYCGTEGEGRNGAGKEQNWR